MAIDLGRLEALFGADSVGPLMSVATCPPSVAGLPVVAPATFEALCEVVRCAGREKWHLLPAGAGTHLYLAEAGAPFDLVLSTRRLDRVLEHEPEDMVMVVESGVTLHDIDKRSAPAAQRLGPDPWRDSRATIGGAVAGMRAGAERLGHGTFRDVVLGARVVHADGSTSKTGGKVVKNVAGYDLSKLYTGACGRLVMLAEINLRLVPRPLEHALVVARVARTRCRDLLDALQRAPIAPTALLLVAGDLLPGEQLPTDSVAIVVRLEGRDRVVQAQVGAALAVTGGEEWTGTRAQAAWDAVQASFEPRPDTCMLRLSTLPQNVNAALEAVTAAPIRLRSFVGQAAIGVCVAHLGAMAPNDWASVVQQLRAGGVQCNAVYPTISAGFDAATVEPGLARLERRTHEAFDPERRFAGHP